jgi:hypothetical protein
MRDGWGEGMYEHLIFTARLQATQQVRANNSYLAKGLGWGQAKVKQAKSWLHNAGLIEYVRARKDNGLLGEVYIRLSYLPTIQLDNSSCQLSKCYGETQDARSNEGN